MTPHIYNKFCYVLHLIVQMSISLLVHDILLSRGFLGTRHLISEHKNNEMERVTHIKYIGVMRVEDI